MMTVKMILCFIILAQFACVSAICDIISSWLKKKDKFDLYISFASRGTGELNSKRGWK